jgi:hypothetical protein
MIAASVSITSVERVLKRQIQPSNSDRFWSIKIGQKVDKFTGEKITITNAPISTMEQWSEHLLTLLIDTSNDIHRKCLRGPADFVVLPKSGPLLNLVMNINKRTLYQKYENEEAKSKNRIFVDADYIGIYNSRFRLFETNKLPANQILLGRLGDGFFTKYLPQTPATPGNPIPTINIQIATANPNIHEEKIFMKNEVAYWGFIKVLDIEEMNNLETT